MISFCLTPTIWFSLVLLNKSNIDSVRKELAVESEIVDSLRKKIIELELKIDSLRPTNDSLNVDSFSIYHTYENN